MKSTTLDIADLSVLAVAVRREFNAYDGEKWSGTGVNRVPIKFTIIVPELKFSNASQMTRGTARVLMERLRYEMDGVRRTLEGITLHQLHLDTGIVTVSVSLGGGAHDDF